MFEIIGPSFAEEEIGWYPPTELSDAASGEQKSK